MPRDQIITIVDLSKCLTGKSRTDVSNDMSNGESSAVRIGTLFLSLPARCSISETLRPVSGLISVTIFSKSRMTINFPSCFKIEMRRKGESLGADAQLSKPEIGQLVDAIDKLLLKSVSKWSVNS